MRVLVAVLLGAILGVTAMPITRRVQSYALASKGPSSNPIDLEFWKLRCSQFNNLAPTKIVLLGDSRIEYGLWNELLPGLSLENRGIGGDTASGVLQRLDQAVPINTPLVILEVGINDLNVGRPTSTVANDIGHLVEKISERQVGKIVILEVFPENTDIMSKHGIKRNIPDINKKVAMVNRSLAGLATPGIVYLSISALHDATGSLSAENTFDGIHLNALGYERWAKALEGACVLRL